MYEKIRVLVTVVMVELVLLHSTYSCRRRTIIQSGITEHDKQSILDSHNKIRQTVALGQVEDQPPAANMVEMQWSDQLARRAQQWAEACSSTIHDPGRHLGELWVGQNIATKWTTRRPASYYDLRPDWDADAIVKWFNENTLYSFGSFRNLPAGHYTQLIWAQTTHVGCGFVLYLDGTKYTKKYVCNYGPSGNVLGETPYHKGYTKCLSYGMAESKTYPGLCDAPTAQGSNYYGDRYNKGIISNELRHNYNFQKNYLDFDRSNSFFSFPSYLSYSHQ